MEIQRIVSLELNLIIISYLFGFELVYSWFFSSSHEMYQNVNLNFDPILVTETEKKQTKQNIYTITISVIAESF